MQSALLSLLLSHFVYISLARAYVADSSLIPKSREVLFYNECDFIELVTTFAKHIMAIDLGQKRIYGKHTVKPIEA